MLAGASGCASSGTAAAPSARVGVRLADFSMTTGRISVPAGPVVLHVTNAGPSAHGLYVDRTEYSSGALPLRKDNLGPDEHAKGTHLGETTMSATQTCTTVAGVFATRDAAEKAIADLRVAGYRDDQIGLVAKGPGGKAGLVSGMAKALRFTSSMFMAWLVQVGSG